MLYLPILIVFQANMMQKRFKFSLIFEVAELTTAFIAIYDRRDSFVEAPVYQCEYRQAQSICKWN